jgi:hypothetical protein
MEKFQWPLLKGAGRKNADGSTWSVCQGRMQEAHGAVGCTARSTWCDYRLRSGDAEKNVDEQNRSQGRAEWGGYGADPVLARLESSNAYQA